MRQREMAGPTKSHQGPYPDSSASQTLGAPTDPISVSVLDTIVFRVATVCGSTTLVAKACACEEASRFGSGVVVCCLENRRYFNAVGKDLIFTLR